jgi:hypothetical protein
MAPFAHVAATHFVARQTLVAQSCAPAQLLPSLHGLHVPPQSTSPSVPFFMESVHVGVVQEPSMHDALAQSCAPWQRFPLGQTWQLPPQSTSLSVAFFFPSWQVMGTEPSSASVASGAVAPASLCASAAYGPAPVSLVTLDCGILPSLQFNKINVDPQKTEVRRVFIGVSLAR